MKETELLFADQLTALLPLIEFKVLLDLLRMSIGFKERK